MIAALTRPTWGRISLWIVLAGGWTLFLLGELSTQAHPRHPVFGAAFGVAVMGWLVGMALATLQRRA